MEIDKVLKKMDNGREYRNVYEIRALEDEKQTVSGYATVFNTPYLLADWGDYKVYEKIDRNAFADCDMSDVIMQYNHEGRVFARISNSTLKVSVDNKGLFCEADLHGTELGRQLYEEIKGGYTNKMSFGFIVGEDVREITEDKQNGVTTVVRTITKISKLFDVSAVSIPANDYTSISARNYGEGVIAEIKAERLKAENEKRKKQKIKILCGVS